MMSLRSTVYDYIVIGAGSAGCVVANRLSKNPRNSVLLLESGGSDKSPIIQMPAATYVKGIGNPKYDWSYKTEPDASINQRTDVWPRGKVLGGTSSINGLLYVRGFPQDYDNWRDQGNPGWGWSDVLSLFVRQEDFTGTASSHHGRGGLLSNSELQDPHPVAEKFIQSAKACGIPYNEDINGPNIGGFGYVQSTRRRGWRCNSARAFLHPIKKRRNLTVSTHSTARRILFENRKATGVEVNVLGNVQQIKANLEVVVCAGTIASPQLLLLSGIGNSADLGNLGIEAVTESPNVGQNLQDHPGLGMTFESSVPTFNNEMAIWKLAIHCANWYLFGRGIATTPDAHLVGFIRSDSTNDLPDIQVHFTPAGYLVAGEGDLILKESSFTTVVSVCRPRSRGRIELATRDPDHPPLIRHQLFGDSDDLNRLVRGIRVVRTVVNTAPLSNIVRRSISPHWNTVEDSEIAEYLRSYAGTIYHPCGTCRMGPNDHDVVDSRLRVRGIHGVRVADASIMPTLISGNLNATCMMIGEKAADMILNDEKT